MQGCLVGAALSNRIVVLNPSKNSVGEFLVDQINDFLSALQWRNATKNFDPTRPLAPELLGQLLDAARLAPSSYGLQPWKFVVVQDVELRKELRAHAWNQPQITDAACVVVMCSLRQIDRSHIDRYLNQIIETRGVTPDSVRGFGEVMINSVDALSPQANRNWAMHQVYIALGVLLSACALSGVDACPMEGFDKPSFDRILDLEKMGIASCVLCALGYRKSEATAAVPKKVRFAPSDVVLWR